MSKEEPTLEDKLKYEPEHAWEKCDEEEIEEIKRFCEGYKEYLSYAKTEREVVDKATVLLEEAGFSPLKGMDSLKPGDKVYFVNRNKSLVIAVIGKKDIQDGVNIVTSHIDSPRMDLKARPLYQDNDSLMAVFKTHYYGGIKKYQWVSTPLAIHGRVVKEDGTTVDIVIGEEDQDPVLVVSDLLPHLSKKAQSKRKMKDVIKGEELNVIVGGRPIDDDDVEEKLKMNVLKLLNDEYDITEEDFVSAEIEIVPAGAARDVGLDRSMLGGYGQDDRVCAYTSLIAALDLKESERTAIVVMFDKEEIGSVGNTGAASKFVEIFLSELLELANGDYTQRDLQKTLSNSRAISGDGSAGVNPSFKSVHEMRNAAKLGKGIVLTKFTGAGGKFSANDAHAEYVGWIRGLFNRNDIPWQPCELGKVDEGGGGTVARDIANLNIDVIDAGPAVLGMHAPFEITSKIDIYHTYRAYLSFLNSE